jgi:ethanolamine utilization microcompartment shell protein EutS
MLSETLLGITVGIGLSAACGFRVFVPLLVMNLASLTGNLHLSSGFEWIGNYYATIAFGMATIVEILAYYIPWLDHILDLIASPAAIVAGTIATASMVMDISPFLRWTLAIIAGGGVAAIVQGVTVTLRTKSSVLTAGTGNVLVSSVELAGSIITALLAMIVPMVCLVLIALLCIFVIRKAGRLFFGRIKIK